MPGLKSWFDLEPGGVVVRDKAVQPRHRRMAHGRLARGRPRRLRRLPALLARLPRLGGAARRNPRSAIRPRSTARAASSAPPSARLARSRWCPMATDLTHAQLLTGGEAIVEAMRQIDPDVVPVYPITPQTPIIQGYAKAPRRRKGPR